MAVHRGQMSVLCFLDLSAGFDTVDRDLLLQRLERQFGLCGTISAQAATTDFVDCDVSGSRWTDSLARLVYAVVHHGSITATLFLLVHQGQSWTSYSVC